MSSVAGPSTPSRKRSKWEGDEGEETRPASPVRRVKQKVAPPPPAPSSNSQAMQPASTSLRARSKFVPQRDHHPPIFSSRSVYSYERLNQIEEGSYGVVYRARDKDTGEIVALKKLKLEEEKNGFPITALREINALMTCRHENVVNVREVVVGDTLTQCASCFLSLLLLD